MDGLDRRADLGLVATEEPVNRLAAFWRAYQDAYRGLGRNQQIACCVAAYATGFLVVLALALVL